MNDIYFNTGDNSKLIYTIGLLWGKINLKLDEKLSPCGLNTAKFNILMIIKHVGGHKGIQQNEISKRLLVTASNITKLLNKMEQDGLITRNIKKDDKRAKLIKISNKGSSLLDDVWKVYTEQTEQLLSAVPSGKITEIQNLLANWMLNIK